VRMHRIGDCSEGNLMPFVQGAVEPNAGNAGLPRVKRSGIR